MSMPMSTLDHKPFPLFRLPWLASKGVLKSMDISELVALSMISNKCKTAVKAITANQKTALTMLDSFVLVLGYGIAEIRKQDSARSFKKLSLGTHSIVQSTVTSSDLNGFFFKFDTCKVEEEDPIAWVKRLTKFITDVFNIKKIDCSFLSLRPEFVSELIDYTKNELKLGFNRVIINSDAVNDEFYKYILDNCMDAEELQINSKPSDNFQYNVEDLNPKHFVSIEHSEWITAEHLEKFRNECQEALFALLRVSSQELNNFLKQWKQSDKMRRIRMEIHNIDFQQVIHGLDVVHKELDMYEPPEPFEPFGAAVIQRNDGIKASIGYRGDKMIVTTEEEF